jgi:hypothetical protein
VTGPVLISLQSFTSQCCLQMAGSKKGLVQTKKLLPSEEINKHPVVKHYFYLNVLAKQAPSGQQQATCTQSASQQAQVR